MKQLKDKDFSKQGYFDYISEVFVSEESFEEKRITVRR